MSMIAPIPQRWNRSPSASVSVSTMVVSSSSSRRRCSRRLASHGSLLISASRRRSGLIRDSLPTADRTCFALRAVFVEEHQAGRVDVGRFRQQLELP
jgi:hypothetical protein